MKERRIEWARFPQSFFHRFKDGRISSYSIMIAFYFLLSLFPLLVTAATLLPYFNIDPETVLPYLETLMPEPVLNVIMPAVNSLLTQSNGGLLSLGIITTIWSASKIIKHIQQGINAAYGVNDTGIYIVSRIISVGTLILILLLLMVVIVLFSFGELALENFISVSGWAESALYHFNKIKWPIPIVMLILTLSVVYISTPNLRLRVRDVLPGAALSTLLLLGSVRLFALYINHAIQPITAYGTLSSIFILMVWMRLVGYILLIGAVLNATLHELFIGGPPVRRSKADAYLRKQMQRVLGRAERKTEAGDIAHPH